MFIAIKLFLDGAASGGQGSWERCAGLLSVLAAALPCCCRIFPGDDLPGLLHNWGSGLHTISKHATVSDEAAYIVSCQLLLEAGWAEELGQVLLRSRGTYCCAAGALKVLLNPDRSTKQRWPYTRAAMCSVRGSSRWERSPVTGAAAALYHLTSHTYFKPGVTV